MQQAKLLNQPFDRHVCERMVQECQKLKADLTEAIVAKTLDRETYLSKMGELNAVREIEKRLIHIYRGEFGL